AGNENDAAARLDHGRMGKMAGRLADFRRRDLLLGHALAPPCESGPQSAGRIVCNISGCAPALISTRTFRYCQSLRLRSSWGMPGSRQIASPGFSCVSRTRPSSNVISFLPSVSGTIRYGSRCWCHGWRWPGSSITLHTRTCSFSNRILSPIGPSLRVVAVSVAMIDLLWISACCGVSDLLSVELLHLRGTHRRDRGDVVVRPHQDQGVARTSHDLTKAIADIEQRAIAQATIERGIAVRDHHMAQAGTIGGDGGATPHVGEIECD